MPADSSRAALRRGGDGSHKYQKQRNSWYLRSHSAEASVWDALCAGDAGLGGGVKGKRARRLTHLQRRTAVNPERDSHTTERQVLWRNWEAEQTLVLRLAAAAGREGSKRSEGACSVGALGGTGLSL